MTQLYERQDAAEMPETYTDIQLKIFRDRYAFDGEQFPHEAWRRVADAVAGSRTPSRRYWGDRFYDLLRGFKYVPGGRIMAAMGSGADVTAQNCYVLPSPEDSRDGIMDSLRQWVEIQSKGGGVGINMSSLRPRGDAGQGRQRHQFRPGQLGTTFRFHLQVGHHPGRLPARRRHDHARCRSSRRVRIHPRQGNARASSKAATFPSA